MFKISDQSTKKNHPPFNIKIVIYLRLGDIAAVDTFERTSLSKK